MNLDVKVYKNLKDFNLEVDVHLNDKTVGILGQSGSGKSMILKCLTGIETPDEGHIRLNNNILFSSKEKINIKPQKRKIGYLFQNYALFPHMNVFQNIASVLKGNKAEKKNKALSIIFQFGLKGLEDRLPNQLSGGQQQRTALARVIACQPDVLLLDEPFSALDDYIKESLQLEMTKSLDDYLGNAIIVSHSKKEIYSMCKNTLVLDKGKVLSFGPTKEIFEKPKILQIAKLIGVKNISRAKIISSNLVEAIDWKVTLEVSKGIPKNLAYVGIHAKDFIPVSDLNSINNSIVIKIKQQIETHCECNIIFENALTQSDDMYFTFLKNSKITNFPQYLHIPPENILMLTEI